MSNYNKPEIIIKKNVDVTKNENETISKYKVYFIHKIYLLNETNDRNKDTSFYQRFCTVVQGQNRSIQLFAKVFSCF